MSPKFSIEEIKNMLYQSSVEHDIIIDSIIVSINKLRDNISANKPSIDYKVFLDNQLSFCLCLLDIKIGLKHLLLLQATGRMVEGNYFARILSLNSLELIKMSSGMIKEGIAKYKNIEQTKIIATEIEEIMKGIAAIRKKNTVSMLEEVRNYLLCHRLGEERKSGFDQAKMMADMDWIKIEEISQKLFDIHLSVSNKLQDLNNLIVGNFHE